MELHLQPAVDLEAVFTCGQAFRWQRVPGGWLGEISGYAVQASTQEGALILHADILPGAKEDFEFHGRTYFDADRDYTAVAQAFRRQDEPWIARAFDLYPGLRLLRQPIFETLITFILSANNNIPRITRILNTLCETLGERLVLEDHAVYRFPSPMEISACTQEQLRAMGMGYRAPYILRTAERICEGFPLEDMARLPYEQALKLLTTLPGVGEKVADCVLLFSGAHLNALPVDVWMERVLRTCFFPELKGKKALKIAAMERFGPYGGIAQQVLFHAARMDSLFSQGWEQAAPNMGAMDRSTVL